MEASFEVYARQSGAKGKGESNVIFDTSSVTQGGKKMACRAAFSASSSTKEIYETAYKHNVEKLLNGTNVHAMVFGAPQTGKSYTLIGSDDPESKDQVGLIQLAVDGIFNGQASSKKYLVLVSMYQIYGSFVDAANVEREFLVDLINPNTSESLPVNEYRESVEGIAEIVCKTSEQAMTYIQQGWAVHKMLSARTSNDKGHVFIDIRVEAADRDEPSRITYGTLRFACLAPVNEQSLQHNRGLRALFDVVTKRANRVDDFEIDFNASKVTQLLRGSLSSVRSNAIGSILMCFAQDSNDVSASLTLGTMLKTLTTSAKVNFNTVTASIRDLREEIRRRRDELKLDNPTTYLQDIKAESVQTLQRLIIELERVKSLTWKVKRDNSAEVLRQRVARLRAEGFASVLNENNAAKVPKQLRDTANKHLEDLVAEHYALQRVEADLARAKQIMTNTRGAGKSVENVKNLEKQLNDAVVKYNRAVSEFMSAQKQILLQEAKLAKSYLFPEDVAALQRARDSEFWSDVTDERKSRTKAQLEEGKGKAQELKDLVMKSTDADKSTVAEKVAKEVAELTAERDALLRAIYRKDAAHEVQMQRFQEHMFFVFRNYRSHFEEQKSRIEQRYRELLESSVKDALKLQEECNRLRIELHKNV